MRLRRGVFNTDQVNLARMRCPAEELMRAEEAHQRECMARGIAPGLPSNIAHDMHRLVGWTQPFGLYIDGRMVRVLGGVEEAETGEEKMALQARGEAYWEAYHAEGAATHRQALASKLCAVDLTFVQFLRLEGVVAAREGLAAEIYPDLFTPGASHVDKDGLVDYRHLLTRMEQIQPGVFHDPVRGLLLFAHRFHRRSLSHRNKLNSYFLQSFDTVAQEQAALRVRLRLDPDIVGEPTSAQNLIELEHWRGPLFNEDIASIPDGVAEHKADERSRFFEGVDRTQVWWKAPESRDAAAGGMVNYRTFEIEELIENPSGGLAANHFGCRYAHAEFSSGEDAITHFDGAVRAYSGEHYLERIETSIDRAGKQAHYTKLFRFDGALPVVEWKRLLCDFFRGNKLIPEYLGAPEDVEIDSVAEGSTNDRGSTTALPLKSMELAALITLEPGTIVGPVDLFVEQVQQIGEMILPFIEVGRGEVGRYLRGRFDVASITSLGFDDDVLNMARMVFAATDTVRATFQTEVAGLASAIREDADSGLISRAAIPLAWERDGLITTLTIAGDVDKVVATLDMLGAVADPSAPAEDWIEALSDLIKSLSRPNYTDVSWTGVDRGVLAIPRSGEILVSMEMPDAVRQNLHANGLLASAPPPEPPV